MRKGSRHSEESKEKLRQANLGKKASDEAKIKMSQAHLGHECSEETRDKIRKALLGKKRSPETIEKMKLFRHTKESRRKLSESHKGKKLSKETRRKISLSLTGKKHSDESRKKMSLAQTGRKHSEETRKKLSISHMGNKSSLGYKYTEEQKLNLSIATTKRFSDPNVRKKHSECMLNWWKNNEAAQQKAREKSRQSFNKQNRISKGEARLHSILSGLGVGFEKNFFILLSGRWLFADAFISQWKGVGLILEYDGHQQHTTEEGIKKDKGRDLDVFLERGILTYRIRRNEIFCPEIENRIASILSLGLEGVGKC